MGQNRGYQQLLASKLSIFRLAVRSTLCCWTASLSLLLAGEFGAGYGIWAVALLDSKALFCRRKSLASGL